LLLILAQACPRASLDGRERDGDVADSSCEIYPLAQDFQQGDDYKG